MSGLLVALLLAADGGSPGPALARELEKEASELQRAGKYAEAEKPLREAIAVWTKLKGPGDIEVLNDTMNLAVAYRRHGDAARAVPMLEKVEQALAASKDPDAPELRRRALNNLAAAYRFAERNADAVKTWEGLLAQLEKEPVTEERARVLDNLASAVHDAGDAERAEKYAKAGYAAWQKLRGEQDVDTAISRTVVGSLAAARGDFVTARRHYEAALKVKEKLLGADHPGGAATLNLLGVLEAKVGNTRAARAHFERSLAISRKRLDPKHPQILEAEEGLRALGRKLGN